MTDLGYKEIEPVGTEQVAGHVSVAGKPHVWGTFDAPVYPADAKQAGRRLRNLRVSLGMNLRDGADAIGLSVVQLSRVESGGALIDFDLAHNMLESCPWTPKGTTVGTALGRSPETLEPEKQKPRF